MANDKTKRIEIIARSTTKGKTSDLFTIASAMLRKGDNVLIIYEDSIERSVPVIEFIDYVNVTSPLTLLASAPCTKFYNSNKWRNYDFASRKYDLIVVDGVESDAVDHIESELLGYGGVIINTRITNH